MIEQRRFNTDQFQFAVEHALATHTIAEQERARLAACADVETLRGALEELELPAEDIEQALGSLEEAMATRTSGRRRGALVAWVAGLVLLGGGLVAWLALRSTPVVEVVPAPPPPPPTALISLSYQGFEEAPSQTWKSSAVLGGEAETALAALLRERGLLIVERLEPAARQQIFPAGATEPLLAAATEQAGASHGALGTLKCVDQGSIMNTAMRSYRVHADFRVLDLGDTTAPILASARLQQVGVGINPGFGCQMGLERLLEKLLPELASQLDSHLPAPAAAAQ